MNTKSIITLVVILLGLLGGVILMQGALSANTSSISYLIKWGGIALAIVAFLRPKYGLYIITAEAFTTDYLKKVAVYYGSTSMQTIIEVMGVVIVAMLATIAGRVVQMIAGTGKKPTIPEWSFYVVGAAISIGVFAGADLDRMAAGQQAFNIGVYVAVGGLMIGLLDNYEDLWKYFKFMIVFGVAWSLMALKQSFMGYSALEDHYALTGLSPTSTAQYFQDRDGTPRPSGFGSGAVNLTTLGIFVPLLLWATINRSIAWAAAFIIVLSAIVFSQLKTLIFGSLILIVAYPLIRRGKLVAACYVIAIPTLICLIAYSQYLLDHIYPIDEAYRGFLGLGESWSILTFSDRLYGWLYLTDMSNFSLFPGTKPQFDTHDQLTLLLQKLGLVITGIGAVVVAFLLFHFHRAIRWIPLGPQHRLAMAMSTYVVFSIFSGVMSGGFLQGQPQGLVVWCAAGSVFLLSEFGKKSGGRNQSNLERAPSPAPTASHDQLPLGSR